MFDATMNADPKRTGTPFRVVGILTLGAIAYVLATNWQSILDGFHRLFG